MTTVAGKPDSAGFGRLLEVQGEVKEEAPEPSKADVKKGDSKLITMEEVNKHNTEHDVWIVVNDKVYDCTEYLDLHPGGADSILINAGEDATEDFVAIHSTKATKMLDKFYVGDLDTTSVAVVSDAEGERLCPKTGRKVALDPIGTRLMLSIPAAITASCVPDITACAAN